MIANYVRRNNYVNKVYVKKVSMEITDTFNN